MTPIRHGKRFWKQGEPLVWATGGALSFVLLSTLLLVGIVLYNGLGVFWPSRVAEIALTDGSRLFGQETQTETHPDTGSISVQFKTANRELDPQRLDFRWILDDAIQELTYPEDVVVLERAENGNFFGVLDRVDATGLDVPAVGVADRTTCTRRWMPCIICARARRTHCGADQVAQLRVAGHPGIDSPGAVPPQEGR